MTATREIVRINQCWRRRSRKPKDRIVIQLQQIYRGPDRSVRAQIVEDPAGGEVPRPLGHPVSFGDLRSKYVLL